MLYDLVGETSVIELIAEEYSDVSFVIRIGSFADDWRAQRRVLDELVRHPNVHTDTSGIRRFDLLVEAVQRAGPDKVLFGSDGPWLRSSARAGEGASARTSSRRGGVDPRRQLAPTHRAGEVRAGAGGPGDQSLLVGPTTGR